jgi:cytochrome c553
VNYWVRCRGCKREIAVVIDLDSEDGKQTILGRNFHVLSECSHCHERHFYDYSDMMTGQKAEPALPL